jgi:tetratricopeptide (TPR) repeat protein
MADSAYDTMCRHLYDAAPRMNSIGGNGGDNGSTIPVAVEAIALRCLEKDPIKRYQSAAEVLQAIELYESDPDAARAAAAKLEKAKSGGKSGSDAGGRMAGNFGGQSTGRRGKKGSGVAGFGTVVAWFAGSVVALVLLRSLAIQGVDTYVIGSLVQEAKFDAEQGKMDAADRKLKSAEDWLARLSTIADVSSAGIVGGWRKVAFNYMKVGDTRAEATTLSHIVELETRELGASSPVVISDLTKLGEAYFRAGDATAARQALERAIVLSQKSGGLDKGLVPMYERVLMALREQQRYTEVEQGLKFLLSNANQVGIVDSHKASLIERLAETLFVQQRHDEALTLFLDAKVLKDRFDDVSNPEHIYNSYYAGVSAQLLKKHSQAEVLLKHCLAMQADSKTFVQELPDIYAQIGFALVRQRRFKEAEPYLTKGVETLGRDTKMHPYNKMVTGALLDLALGQVLRETGRESEAKPYLVRASEVSLQHPYDFIAPEAKALLK